MKSYGCNGFAKISGGRGFLTSNLRSIYGFTPRDLRVGILLRKAVQNNQSNKLLNFR